MHPWKGSQTDGGTSSVLGKRYLETVLTGDRGGALRLQLECWGRGHLRGMPLGWPRKAA